MKSDRIRRTTMCLVFVLVSLSVRPLAQDQPDFTGSWILESGAPGRDVPQALSVSQSLARTNVRGEPTKPFFKDIVVTRSLPSGTRSERYQIGVVGGAVSGRAGASTDRPQTHYRVAWEEQTLVIESDKGDGTAVAMRIPKTLAG